MGLTFFFLSPLEHFCSRGGGSGGGCYPVEGPGDDYGRGVRCVLI